MDKALRAETGRLVDFVSASSSERKFSDVRIYDTDDPDMILRMGALAPDMVNCFNYHGNPAQTHVLTGVLGSRNARLVVVEAGGQPTARYFSSYPCPRCISSIRLLKSAENRQARPQENRRI